MAAEAPLAVAVEKTTVLVLHRRRGVQPRASKIAAVGEGTKAVSPGPVAYRRKRLRLEHYLQYIARNETVLGHEADADWPLMPIL